MQDFIQERNRKIKKLQETFNCGYAKAAQLLYVIENYSDDEVTIYADGSYERK